MPKAAGGGVGQMRVRVGELRDKLMGYARMLEEDNVWARGHLPLCNRIIITSQGVFEALSPALLAEKRGQHTISAPRRSSQTLMRSRLLPRYLTLFVQVGRVS